MRNKPATKIKNMNKGSKKLINAGVAMPHAEEQQDTQLLERHNVDGDIDIVHHDGKCFALLGIHKISRDYDSEAEQVLKDKIISRDWEIIIGVIGAVITFQKGEKNG